MTHERPLHITISGDLGSGKSSVASVVAERLSLELVSTGDIQRGIARELQLSTLQTNLLAEKNREIDRRVDSVTRDLGASATNPIVFDSRMAWFMLETAFRVRLIVDPTAAVERILQRGASDVEAYAHRQHAESDIRKRYESEVRRFLARYGVDVTALKHFDLVIDTSDADVETVAKIVTDTYLGKGTQGVFASPRRLVPTDHLLEAPPDEGEIEVVYARPYMLAVRGRSALTRAIDESVGLVAVRVAAEGYEEVRSHQSVLEFARSCAMSPAIQTWSAAHHLNFEGFIDWAQRTPASA